MIAFAAFRIPSGGPETTTRPFCPTFSSQPVWSLIMLTMYPFLPINLGTFVGDILTISPFGTFPSPGPRIEICGSLDLSKASILQSSRSPTLNLLLRSCVAGENSLPKTNEAGGEAENEEVMSISQTDPSQIEILSHTRASTSR